MNHETFNNESRAAPALAPTSLIPIEEQLGCDTPDDYANFLRQCNGGHLDAKFQAFDIHPNHLYGLRDDPVLSITAAITRFTNRLNKGMLPIANTHEDDLLVLWHRGDDQCELWYLPNPDNPPPPTGYQSPTRITPTFTAFFNALTKLSEPDDNAQ